MTGEMQEALERSLRPRGRTTFKLLKDWPGEERPIAGGLQKPVVEVSVEYSVSDIAAITVKVEEMDERHTPRTIWTPVSTRSQRTGVNTTNLRQRRGRTKDSSRLAPPEDGAN